MFAPIHTTIGASIPRAVCNRLPHLTVTEPTPHCGVSWGLKSDSIDFLNSAANPRWASSRGVLVVGPTTRPRGVPGAAVLPAAVRLSGGSDAIPAPTARLPYAPCSPWIRLFRSWRSVRITAFLALAKLEAHCSDWAANCSSSIAWACSSVSSLRRSCLTFSVPMNSLASTRRRALSCARDSPVVLPDHTAQRAVSRTAVARRSHVVQQNHPVHRASCQPAAAHTRLALTSGAGAPAAVVRAFAWHSTLYRRHQPRSPMASAHGSNAHSDTLLRYLHHAREQAGMVPCEPTVCTSDCPCSPSTVSPRLNGRPAWCWLWSLLAPLCSEFCRERGNCAPIVIMGETPTLASVGVRGSATWGWWWWWVAGCARSWWTWCVLERCRIIFPFDLTGSLCLSNAPPPLCPIPGSGGPAFTCR